MNRSAFVTGGGSGIGLACACAFAREGLVVGLFGRSQERLDSGRAAILAEIPGARVLTFSGDVSDEAQVTDALLATNSEAPLKIAIANAGTGGIGPFTDTDLDNYDAVMRVNARGALVTFKQAAALLIQNGGGALCAISSIAGVRTHRYMAAYTMSKAAIDMLVRTSADELGAKNIRVNSVCPGLVDTELAGGLLNTDAVYQDYIDCMPLARHGQVQDVAAAVAFLCGNQASWITGVNLSVDGGHHLRRGPNLDAFFEPDESGG